MILITSQMNIKMLKIKLKLKEQIRGEDLIGKRYRHTENESMWEYIRIEILRGKRVILYKVLLNADGLEHNSIQNRDLDREIEDIKNNLFLPYDG